MEKKMIINSLCTERDDNGYIYYKGKLFTGVEEWYREDGTLGTTTEYVDGVPDGVMTGWYHDGKKRSQIQYKKGRVHGISLKWYENGQKKVEEEIYNGKAVYTKEWDGQGNLIIDK